MVLSCVVCSWSFNRTEANAKTAENLSTSVCGIRKVLCGFRREKKIKGKIEKRVWFRRCHR